MTRALVVAEAVDGHVSIASLEVIGAASALGVEVDVAVVSANAEALAAQVRSAGVTTVLAIRVGNAEPGSDALVAALTAVVEERRPAIVLAPHSPGSMGWVAAVAARTGAGFASDAIGMRLEDGRLVTTRAVYGGKLHADLDFPGRDVVLVTLRAGTWPAVDAAGDPTVEVRDGVGSQRVVHVRYEPAPVGDVDITAADVLVAIGRGIGDREEIPRYEELAEALGATLAVSRPLVDAGWAPAARQVGQSGKTVAPRVYVALGISGAVQHLAGMKTSGTIVAVNTDPDAAIFGVAHLGATCDMHDLADALERALG